MSNTSVQSKWSAASGSTISKLSISSFLIDKSVSLSRYNAAIAIEDIHSNKHHSLQTLEQMFYEDCYVEFPNYEFFLRNLILKCESVNVLKERLLEINRWCFLNVGPRDYGFYNPIPFTYNRNEYIRIVDFNDTIDALSCVVFKHSSDLLAFKLKF